MYICQTSNKININIIDGYTLSNNRQIRSSTNYCYLKPDDNEPIFDSSDWIVNGGKLCLNINTTRASTIDEFLIYGKSSILENQSNIEYIRYKLKHLSIYFFDMSLYFKYVCSCFSPTSHIYTIRNSAAQIQKGSGNSDGNGKRMGDHTGSDYNYGRRGRLRR